MPIEVNAPILAPDPPGPWVSPKGTPSKLIECVCGDHPSRYTNAHYGIGWMDGVNLVRQTNQAAELAGEIGGQTTFDLDDPPGGFRSRGGVLWAMHVLKLEEWYADHANCGVDQIVDDWPAWWEEQEEIARSQGFTGEWDWGNEDEELDQVEESEDEELDQVEEFEDEELDQADEFEYF